MSGERRSRASLHLVEFDGRLERRAHDRDCSGEIAEHELRAHADDAEACSLELAIAARVSGQPARVNGAVDLDDELDTRRQEISDEETCDRGLAPKRNTELTSFEGGPEHGFRLGELRAVLSSKELEPSCGFRIE